MTAAAGTRVDLVLHEVNTDAALFSTTLDHPPSWATPQDLAHLDQGIARWGFAYLDGHPVDAKDRTQLLAAIRAARPLPECPHEPPCDIERECRALQREEA